MQASNSGQWRRRLSRRSSSGGRAGIIYSDPIHSIIFIVLLRRRRLSFEPFNLLARSRVVLHATECEWPAGRSLVAEATTTTSGSGGVTGRPPPSAANSIDLDALDRRPRRRRKNQISFGSRRINRALSSLRREYDLLPAVERAASGARHHLLRSRRGQIDWRYI